MKELEEGGECGKALEGDPGWASSLGREAAALGSWFSTALT